MSWARFDDAFDSDPDLDEISPTAACLHVCGTTYCARELTDGRVPKGRVIKLHGGADPSALADLLRVGWWVDEGTYYLIRSYLKYNKSKEQVLREREMSYNRVNKFRNGGQVDSENGEVTQDVTPLPGANLNGPLPYPDSSSGFLNPGPKNQECVAAPAALGVDSDKPAPKPKRVVSQAKHMPLTFNRLFTEYGHIGTRVEAIQAWDKAQLTDEDVDKIDVFFEAIRKRGWWDDIPWKHFCRFVLYRVWEGDIESFKPRQLNGKPARPPNEIATNPDPFAHARMLEERRNEVKNASAGQT